MNGSGLRCITATRLNHIAHVKCRIHEGLEAQSILQGGEGMSTLTFSGVV